MKKLLTAASVPLMAAAMALSLAAPPIGGGSRPFLEDRASEFDGRGRRKRVVSPRQPRTRAWREYAERVRATHSFNEDPRDDRYLHSSQRRARYDAIRAREAKAPA